MTNLKRMASKGVGKKGKLEEPIVYIQNRIENLLYQFKIMTTSEEKPRDLFNVSNQYFKH